MGVVGFQHAADQQEEVAEPAFRQGITDGHSGIPFTQFMVAHMGMGDRVVAGRRMGIQGQHFVRGEAAGGTQAFQMEPDPKGAQRDLFQRDGRGDDGQHSGGFIVPAAEFVRHLVEFPGQILDREHHPRRGEGVLGVGDLGGETGEQEAQFAQDLVLGVIPALLLGEGQPPPVGRQLFQGAGQAFQGIKQRAIQVTLTLD
jgi:hypothetical protein